MSTVISRVNCSYQNPLTTGGAGTSSKLFPPPNNANTYPQGIASALDVKSMAALAMPPESNNLSLSGVQLTLRASGTYTLGAPACAVFTLLMFAATSLTDMNNPNTVLYIAHGGLGPVPGSTLLLSTGDIPASVSGVPNQWFFKTDLIADAASGILQPYNAYVSADSTTNTTVHNAVSGWPSTQINSTNVSSTSGTISASSLASMWFYLVCYFSVTEPGNTASLYNFQLESSLG